MFYYYDDSGIPDQLHTLVQEYGPNGIAALAFTPSGGWVIVSMNGDYCASGIPDDCFQQLVQYINNGDLINVMAFTPDGGWVIVTNTAYCASGIPDDCFSALVSYFNAGYAITCIAFPPAGGDSWVILAGGILTASNIDDECFQFLCNYLPSTRQARWVVFPPQGGWAILAGDYYEARGIPDDCFAQFGAFIQAGALPDLLAFAPDGGWSLISNTPDPYNPPDTIRQIEENIMYGTGSTDTIWNRMRHYNVPGVSMAVVLNNQVAWATSYGTLEEGGDQYVYTDTAFQAASCSKPVSALGYYQLVQNGLIAFDANINPYMPWNPPVCPSATPSWLSLVTIQLLLQHRGGISGEGVPDPQNQCSNFGGFSGYPNVPGQLIPSLMQILEGAPPANSGPIQLTYEPSLTSPQYYSGPGYMIMMYLLEQLTGQDFGTYMQTNVLAPLGMNNSSFDLYIPANLSRAAAGHDQNGNMYPGGGNNHPEATAAGLRTNPTDYCQMICCLNQNGTLNGNTILTPGNVNYMVQQSTGTFSNWAPNAQNFNYCHNGINAGFKCIFYGFSGIGAGLMIMTNGDNGDSLYTEIATTVVQMYNW
ncbi:serine hydrolase domain-containing protein [Dinghuibacter silviterrae]|uniref:Beta-lactamase n=1 Tax=Dinghuibacter silviterrae TaxID=1539049 RepID=A0A4R8DUS6_9BACT|nr:serine hydrolase domain-containing protein [Dinghuibacter silviterrae]TDX02150.1 beta-lactamase [Dinghuibacter silviterrae]